MLKYRLTENEMLRAYPVIVGHFGLHRLRQKACRRRYIKLIMLFCCFIIPYNQVYADNLSLFREIVRVNSRVKSIDAAIIQHIYTPEHYKEVYKGRYRADNLQRFRIDYTIPSRQIVVNDGKGLF